MSFIRYSNLPDNATLDDIREGFDDLIAQLTQRDIQSFFGPAAVGYQVSGTVPVSAAREYAVSAGSTPAEQTLGRLIQDLKTKGILG